MFYRQAQCKDPLLTGRRPELLHDALDMRQIDMFLPADQPVLSAPDALKRHYHQDQNSTRKYRAIRLVAMSKSVRGPQNILALPVISGFSSMEGLSSSVSTVNVLPLVLSTRSSALVATD